MDGHQYYILRDLSYLNKVERIDAEYQASSCRWFLRGRSCC